MALGTMLPSFDTRPLRLAAALLGGLLLAGAATVPSGIPGAASRQAATGCGECARRAYVGEVDAGATGVVLRESLVSRLAEVLTSPCFRLQRTDISVPEAEKGRFGSEAGPPEYVFEAKYEENLNLRGADGAAVMNRLTVSLSYDGEPREPVASWTVTSPVNSYTACTNRMFVNSDAVMKGARPIEALLEDFERRPASCRVHPAKKDLACGETADLMIAELKDARSRQARPFNRIVVEAEKGAILGGAEIAGRPRAKAFLVDDGLLELRYRAPDEEAASGEDVVSVFSSCDVARPDRLPLSKTSPFRKIGECRFEVHCGTAPGTVLYRRSVSWDSGNTNAAGSTVYKGSLAEEAVVRVELEFTNSYQTKDYYRSAKAAADYSFSYRNDVFISGGKADVLCEKVDGSGAIGPNDSAVITLVVDRPTGAYELSVGLRTPEKQGRGSWSIGVNTLPGLLKGTAAGRVIRGSYAAPGEGPATWPGKRDNQGNDRGTRFEWNLELPDRK